MPLEPGIERLLVGCIMEMLQDAVIRRAGGVLGEKVDPCPDARAALHDHRLDAAAVEFRMTFQAVEQFPSLRFQYPEHLPANDLSGPGAVEQIGQAIGNERIFHHRPRFAQKFAAGLRHDVVVFQTAFEGAVGKQERGLIGRRWRVRHDATDCGSVLIGV